MLVDHEVYIKKVFDLQWVGCTKRCISGHYIRESEYFAFVQRFFDVWVLVCIVVRNFHHFLYFYLKGLAVFRSFLCSYVHMNTYEHVHMR